MSEELVTFFKALADKNRLKIVGLLAEKSYSVEELSELLGLKPPTISHHLSKLVEAGLVRARAEGYYSVYQLDQAVLESKSRSMFSQQELAPAEDQSILMAIVEAPAPSGDAGANEGGDCAGLVGGM